MMIIIQMIIKSHWLEEMSKGKRGVRTEDDEWNYEEEEHQLSREKEYNWDLQGKSDFRKKQWEGTAMINGKQLSDRIGQFLSWWSSRWSCCDNWISDEGGFESAFTVVALLMMCQVKRGIRVGAKSKLGMKSMSALTWYNWSQYNSLCAERWW